MVDPEPVALRERRAGSRPRPQGPKGSPCNSAHCLFPPKRTSPRAWRGPCAPGLTPGKRHFSVLQPDPSWASSPRQRSESSPQKGRGSSAPTQPPPPCGGARPPLSHRTGQNQPVKRAGRRAGQPEAGLAAGGGGASSPHSARHHVDRSSCSLCRRTGRPFSPGPGDAPPAPACDWLPQTWRCGGKA